MQYLFNTDKSTHRRGSTILAVTCLAYSATSVILYTEQIDSDAFSFIEKACLGLVKDSATFEFFLFSQRYLKVDLAWYFMKKLLNSPSSFSSQLTVPVSRFVWQMMYSLPTSIVTQSWITPRLSLTGVIEAENCCSEIAFFRSESKCSQIAEKFLELKLSTITPTISSPFTMASSTVRVTKIRRNILNNQQEIIPMIIKTKKSIVRSLFPLVPIYGIYQPPVKTQTVELDLFKQYKAGLIRRPLTFDEKCLIVNDPKMIAHIELVEYGMTFRPTKRLLVLALLVSGVIITYLCKNTPHPISQRFFSVSQQSREHKFGYLGAMFSFESVWKIMMYAPAFVGLLISSRYLKGVDFLVLMSLGAIGNYYFGNKAIEEKLKTFQVWDRYKITAGEPLILSILTSFLCLKAKSFTDLFNNVRLRLFFQARPGLGITSVGIPIIAPLLLYFAYQLYSCYSKDKPKQLLLYYAVSGALYGFIRRLIFRSL